MQAKYGFRLRSKTTSGRRADGFDKPFGSEQFGPELTAEGLRAELLTTSLFSGLPRSQPQVVLSVFFGSTELNITQFSEFFNFIPPSLRRNDVLPI